MDGRDEVAQVRRFNRALTQRIGALDEHVLGRDRFLGAARPLFAIGGVGRRILATLGGLARERGHPVLRPGPTAP